MSMAYTANIVLLQIVAKRVVKITFRHHRGYQQLSFLADIDFDLKTPDSYVIERTYLLSDDLRNQKKFPSFSSCKVDDVAPVESSFTPFVSFPCQAVRKNTRLVPFPSRTEK